ncbi:MAG: hypothetical protein QOJ39_2091, partial [Candidatus Eremiobacteraeota bacterium]|nr:hypothetical protein [Candidatus Eremiobacteraeota bacterium]
MILASPGSDPGEARARATAVVPVTDPHAVAAAARACTEPYVLLLGPGARPLQGAFGGLSAALSEGIGVIGGAAHSGAMRRFGWMLACAPVGLLPFELVEVSAPVAEAGAEARVRGPIDVVAPGMVLAARELL